MSPELFSSDVIADLNIKGYNPPVQNCLNSLCDIGKCSQGLGFDQMNFFSNLMQLQFKKHYCDHIFIHYGLVYGLSFQETSHSDKKWNLGKNQKTLTNLTASNQVSEFLPLLLSRGGRKRKQMSKCLPIPATHEGGESIMCILSHLSLSPSSPFLEEDRVLQRCLPHFSLPGVYHTLFAE